MKCENCKHEEKYHAIAENHILNTSHCTQHKCNCKELIGDR